MKPFMQMKRAPNVLGIKEKARVSNGHWDRPNTAVTFMNDLSRTLGLENWEDWYSVGSSAVKRHGGSSLLYRHNNSLYKLLLAVYPERSWKADRFSSAPRSYWNDFDRHKNFFENFASEHGIKKMEDWYEIRQRDILAFGGDSVLKYHGGSFKRALASAYPDYHFRWNSFSRERPQDAALLLNESVSSNGEVLTPRQVFDRIGEKLRLKRWEDWYEVPKNQILKFSESIPLILRSNGSKAETLMQVYPDRPWRRDLFDTKKRKRTFIKGTDREILDAVAARLGIVQWEDWYKIKGIDVSKNGGGSVLYRHGNSLFNALRNTYPEHNWQAWRLSCVPQNYWTNEETVREAVQQASHHLRIFHLDDWARISVAELSNLVGESLLVKYGGLMPLLARVYPDHDWSKFRSDHDVLKVQGLLFDHLHNFFRGADIFQNYPHPSLLFSKTNQPMELDVFIPSLSLAFEYQGEQHYRSSSFFGVKSDERDKEKALACERAGITLIVIPHWWDLRKESLAASIHMACPHLNFSVS
eukprot:TRINITY_DN6924_c0_g1_i1.p1 TRINITY_DN6924_c0_g1~~TRINITY_DN6924_c0_g1_i1.p1  ORF type:complete len:527 (-),score=89.84 TRINITY_DN6924_c0_g1_i1:359-1939(-)